MTSKRDYTKIASVIKDERTRITRSIHSDVVVTVGASTRRVANALADYFQEDNPRFDREKFLHACGLQ